MSGLNVISSMVGVISLVVSVQQVIANPDLISPSVRRKANYVQKDLPTLIAFLHDIKNSFLNSREEPPASAEAALDSCKFYADELEGTLHRVYGRYLNHHDHQKIPFTYRMRVHVGQESIVHAYEAFKESVLILKDISLFFMIRSLDEKQLYTTQQSARIESMLVETQRTLLDQSGLLNRTDSQARQEFSRQSQTIIQHTHERHSEKAYQDELDENSMLHLQRNLQREYPDKTVFTAVISPEVTGDQQLKMVVARVLLDTGSDVNIVSEKYLQEVGLSHLIIDIPEEEQFEMDGIEEQGPPWKFKRKFITRFFLYSGSTTEKAEFFVTKSSEWDILISQKQYSKLADRKPSRAKLLWMPKMKRSKKEENDQREFERTRQKQLEDLRNAYDERESQKQTLEQNGRYLLPAGRAWTIRDNRRYILPASMSGGSGSGQGESSIRMNSMDEQRSTRLREASIRSGTMENGSDTEM